MIKPYVARIAFCSLVLLVCGAGKSRCETFEMPIVSVRSISNESGESRILLDIGDIPNEVRGELVTTATLTLRLPGVAPERSIPIFLHRVTTPWRDRNPTWTTPWNEPGGDFESRSPVVGVLWKGREAQSLTLDLSQAIRDMADGEIENQGFLMTIGAHRGEGFLSSDLAAIGDLSGGALRISYGNISHLGFDGSRSIVEVSRTRRN